MRQIAALIVVAILFGCGEAPPASEQNVVPVIDSAVGPAAPPLPNYDDRDGDKYFYVSAVSEEDQKKGKAVGDVSTFRFLGQSRGIYRLELISGSGQRLATAECKRPCKITKVIWVDGRVTRLGHNAVSVLGSAFEDAFNGHLEVSRSARQNSPPSPDKSIRTVPAAFVGEWNENLSDCGTDHNDTRLRIEPTQLVFYESKAHIEGVIIHDPRTITVKGSFSGEGERWTDTYRMTLSASGNDLVTGELTRKRCL